MMQGFNSGIFPYTITKLVEITRCLNCPKESIHPEIAYF